MVGSLAGCGLLAIGFAKLHAKSLKTEFPDAKDAKENQKWDSAISSSG